MEHHEINVYLTSPQFLKYKKAVPFQLTNKQLQADSGKHHVDIHLGKKDYKKLMNAIKNGKGYRFSNKNVVGGSLWGSFKKGLSTVGNFIKNNVNKEDVKNVLKKGVDKVVPDSVKNIAKSAVDKVVDYGYDDNNSGKSLKDHALSLANDLTPELKEAGLQAGKKIVDKVKEKIQGNEPMESGSGLRKFKKGSQEAKEFMAKIRNMRKSKSMGEMRSGGSVRGMEHPSRVRPMKGSPEMKERMAKLRAMRMKKGAGFFDDLASGLIHVGLPAVGHIAGSFLGSPQIGEEIGNMAGDAIGKATGRGLENSIPTPYNQIVGGVPYPVISKESKERIKKKGYHSRQRSKSGFQIVGGSFLQL